LTRTDKFYFYKTLKSRYNYLRQFFSARALEVMILTCIATFFVTHMALRFEKECRKAGYDVRIIPVPRKISSSCGLACRYACEAEKEIKNICNLKNIEVEAFHHLED
jgi:hypothetical protein